MMRRIRLTVSYDGTDYCGSQLQPNGVTVEEKLNRALLELTGERRQVIFASRTDSGVHALGNVAVFDTEMRMEAGRFAFALNQHLPEDIRVRRSDEVEAGWHPRKRNCVKSYEYCIYNSRIPNPLLRRFSAFFYRPLELEDMREGAELLLGEHDFAAFCSSGSQAENTVRTVYGIELSEEECAEREPGGERREEDFDRLIRIRISGSGFLYNMVRIIAGTLLEVGQGKYPPEQIRQILRSRDRRQAGPAAPASGLTLRSVRFVEPKAEIEAENEDWSYVLDQADVGQSGESFLTIRRCRESDYSALLRRLIHQSCRDGARMVFVRDQEKPERLGEGQEYGYYRLRSGRGEFPFAACDRGNSALTF